MKSAKSGLVVGALALAFCLKPNVGWSTRALGALITGEVTATPLGGTIEVDHRSYHVMPNSAAEKALGNFYAGLTVDIVLDGPATSATSQVVAIARHTGT